MTNDVARVICLYMVLIRMSLVQLTYPRAYWATFFHVSQVSNLFNSTESLSVIYTYIYIHNSFLKGPDGEFDA